MYYKQTKVSQPQKENALLINQFAGINISVNNTQIADNETPEMLNMLSDDKGALDSRNGWISLIEQSANESIQAIFEYRKSTGTIYTFMVNTGSDTSFYKIDDINTEPLTATLIASGITTQDRPKAFNFNDLLYVVENDRYMVYDGSTYSAVVGYVPTVAIGSPPAGGGTAFEPKNLISAGFSQEFSGDGASPLYQLLYDGLDSVNLKVYVDGVQLTLNADYTQNLLLGRVDFNGGTAPYGPPAVGINNVEIIGYKTVSGDADKILNCTEFSLYGATEGNRVFLAGDPANQSIDYRSGLLDPTYFPEDGFDNVGRDDDAILGYSFLYGAQIIIKERNVFARQYYESDGEPVFSIGLLNGSIGGVASESISVLDNFPTFVTKKGVYQVISIDPQNEENVRNISEKINRNIDTNPLAISGLLELDDISEWVGIDYDKKYWLFHPTNDIVWLYDYDNSSLTFNQWYRLDGVSANALIEIDDKLYFGRDDIASISRFKIEGDNDLADDEEEDGTLVAIDKRWVSKIFDFQASTNRKLVSKVFFTIKPASKTSATLYVRSDLRSLWRAVKTITSALFTYSLVKYSTWIYAANDFPQQTRTKVKEKKIGYYQIKIENLTETETMGLLNVAIKFIYQREVKR